MRWEEGRQGSGYFKLKLFAFSRLDLYLLKFPKGSSIPPHVDQVTHGRHFRLNFIISFFHVGGEFNCKDPIFETKRVKLFRPDISMHSVTRVQKGTRYVISLGWVLP